MSSMIFMASLLLLTSESASASAGINPGRNRLPEIQSTDQEVKKEPLLLFTKIFPNPFFALGSQVAVQYQVFNVGNQPAQNMVVSDPDFVPGTGKFKVTFSEPKKQLTIKKKKVEDSWKPMILPSGDIQVGDLLAGQNRSFTMNASPLDNKFPVDGANYTFQHAKISYTKTVLEQLVTQIGWSSLSHSEVQILSKILADQLQGSKLVNLLTFILLFSPTILIPFILWFRHTEKYDSLKFELDEIKMEKKVKTKEAKRKYFAARRF